MLGEPKGLEPAEVEVPGKGKLLRVTGDLVGGVIDDVIIIIGGCDCVGSRLRLTLLLFSTCMHVDVVTMVGEAVVVGGAGVDNEGGPVFDSELLDLSF